MAGEVPASADAKVTASSVCSDLISERDRGRSIQSDIRTGAKKFSPAIAGGAPAQRPPTSELEIESTIFVSSGVLVAFA